MSCWSSVRPGAFESTPSRARALVPAALRQAIRTNQGARRRRFTAKPENLDATWQSSNFHNGAGLWCCARRAELREHADVRLALPPLSFAAQRGAGCDPLNPAERFGAGERRSALRVRSGIRLHQRLWTLTSHSPPKLTLRRRVCT